MTNAKPNITIEDSIFIARPTEDIWNFLSDIVNDQQWRRGVMDTRWTSGEPSTLGATAVYVIEGVGEMHWKLTKLEDQRVIGWDYMTIADVIDHGAMAGCTITHVRVANWSRRLRGRCEVMDRSFSGNLYMTLKTVSFYQESDDSIDFDRFMTVKASVVRIIDTIIICINNWGNGFTNADFTAGFS